MPDKIEMFTQKSQKTKLVLNIAKVQSQDRGWEDEILLTSLGPYSACLDTRLKINHGEAKIMVGRHKSQGNLVL